MTLIYDLLYLVAALTIGWPYLIYRRLTRGPSHSTLGELLGRGPSRPVAGHCVWIHGVSLGEINATRTLVAELRRRAPATAVVVSSTTRTGLERARALYPGHMVFRFPLDFSFAVRSVLDRVRPTVIVLMELEVWPNLVEIAAARGISVVVANGRITEERSMRRFRLPLIRGLARRLFRKIAYVGAQEPAYAARFVELGVPAGRVEVTGSLKFDSADVQDRVEGQEALASEMGIDTTAPLLVAGSTGPGEEPVLLDAYRRLLERFPAMQLAIVPRKPERFDEVADLITHEGFVCLRRSTGAPHRPVDDPIRHVFLGDTIGELRMFYGLAHLVFVGRTLAPMGGSDVMEVAALGKPMLLGPHTENFREPVELLIQAGACRTVRNSDELFVVATELMLDPARHAAMAAAARQTIASRRGATARTVERILALDGG